ncbi:MAG: hypothetical protein J6Y53_03040 [Alphaproteobacteria bacterium]|nr:hypothetical protein [Alphaproteobacteria bacterium]
MQINGHKINYTAEKLQDMLSKSVEIKLIDKNFAGYKNLSAGNKKALEHLVAAAKIINDVSLEQDNPYNLDMKKALQKAASSNKQAKLALEMFNSLNGVAGFNGVDSKPIEIFEDIHLLKGHNFYPQDLSVEEFHQILINMLQVGKIEEVRQILSARTMVRRNGKELKAIDYIEYFRNEFSLIANELEVAAHYCDEEEFKDYLGWQAQAFLQNNPDMDMLADKHWAVLQDNNLEFTISRENYDDEITSTVFNNKKLSSLLEKHNIEPVAKDMLGARVGIVNKEGTELILKFKQHIKELANLMPYKDKYHQHILDGEEIKQTMVDVDLVDLEGDYAQCRGGITTAQNLPNNDKLSVKTGGGRRNVYHRQVRMGKDKEKEKKILQRLVSKDLHKYYDSEAIHIFVIGHENGHSLGPDSQYQGALGKYKHIIEEHKADTISLTFMPEYVKKGIISRETLKKIYVSCIVGGMFLRARPHDMLPHRMADLIQFNYLLENKAVSFNAQGLLSIDFDRLPIVFNKLLADTIEVQLSKSPQKAKEFIDKYTKWGRHSQHIAKVHRELGLKPYKKIVRYF